MTQSATVDFGEGHSLRIEETPHPLQLWPAVGGSQVALRIRIAAGQDVAAQRTYMVTGLAQVSRSFNQDIRALCPLVSDHLPTPSRDGTTLTLRGVTTDGQIRALEELRSGADDIWLHIRIKLTCVEETTAPNGAHGTDAPISRDAEHVHGARLAERETTLSFAVTSGEWLKAWEQALSGSYIEVLVPITSAEEQAKAAHRITAARRLLHSGHLEEALGETRKAVEPVRTHYRTPAVAKVAREKPPRERDKDERWALLIEDVFALLSGAVHDDPGTTEDFEWSRTEVIALIATTAGLLGRLAAEPGI